MANILSSTEILKKFQSEDQHLKLIEAVISVGCNTAEVPILIQVFAVLQRVAWFMRNVKPVDSWLSITVSSSGFMRMLIYILKSSSNGKTPNSLGFDANTWLLKVSDIRSTPHQRVGLVCLYYA